MSMGPHKFRPMPSPSKQTTCVKCGRPKSHPTHSIAATQKAA